MTPRHPVPVRDVHVLAEVQQLYAAQSLAIDGGDAVGWAATFTPDGVFDSPTYPEPAQGTEALEAFARAVHENAPFLHHVVVNVLVTGDGPDPAELEVRCNLLIVSTHDLETGAARIDRITTMHDRLRPHAGRWLVAHRRVVRDAP